MKPLVEELLETAAKAAVAGVAGAIGKRLGEAICDRFSKPKKVE